MAANWNAGRLKAYINKINGADDRIAGRTAKIAETNAKANAAVDTGEMRDKTVAAQVGPGHWELRAGAEHSLWVEVGTYKMTAQPWFVPGVMAAGQSMIGIAREELSP